MTVARPRLVCFASAVAVTTLVGATFAVPAGLSSDVVASGSRKPAPALSLRDADGKTVKLSNLKGRVVLLDFWATWCTGCKLEIPWFMEFESKYGTKGLTAVGVSVDEEGWKTVKPYLAQHPISYPIVLGDIDLLEKTFRLPASLPVTLLIDRNGRIAKTHPGVVEREEFEKDIQLLLAEK